MNEEEKANVKKIQQIREILADWWSKGNAHLRLISAIDKVIEEEYPQYYEEGAFKYDNITL